MSESQHPEGLRRFKSLLDAARAGLLPTFPVPKQGEPPQGVAVSAWETCHDPARYALRLWDTMRVTHHSCAWRRDWDNRRVRDVDLERFDACERRLEALRVWWEAEGPKSAEKGENSGETDNG